MSKRSYPLYKHTRKLKRFKIVSLIIGVLITPLRLVLLVPYYIGRLSEWLADTVLLGLYDYLEILIVRVFNWNKVALEQAKRNPEKFGEPKKVFNPRINKEEGRGK